MKKFRRIMALLLATIMVMSMGTAAFAAEGDVKLSVNGPVEGHKYSYYQLFVGALSGTTLSNVKWGADVASSISYKKKATPEATTFTEPATVTASPNGAVPQDVLDYVASLESNQQSTADIISSWVTGDGHEIPEDGVDVAKGYYVVKDAYVNPNAEQTTTLSTTCVSIVGPTAITPKAGTTEHKKEVLDVNDTTDPVIDLSNLQNVATGWDKTADHDFGDHVPFKLTTKIGSDFAKYTSYYLAVTDTLNDGLKLDQASIKVYVDGELATEGTEDGQYSLTKGDKSFKVEFTKLNGNPKAAAGKNVIIYYTATLDKDDANIVIGNPGNVNESYAEFSNNPNGNQTGKGKTPTDTAVVFTYTTDVDKVDPQGAALTGAGFTLYKKVKSAAAIPEGKENVAGTTPAGAKDTTFPADEFWYEVGTVSTGTHFEFKGIDDGTYKLVESTTPATYNTIDPITLEVTAVHGADENSSTNYSVSVLDAGNNDFKADPNGGSVKFTKKNNTEKTLESGEIYSEIVNQQGAQLPSTGGMGTTMFYIVGAAMVIGAGVVLVSRRRMNIQ